jgi:hypothetical protein
MIRIDVVYQHYGRPADAERAIRQMLELTPAEYLGGLKTIVLRDSATLNRERRRSKTRSRGRRVQVNRCEALYHPKWKGEPAWIEIFVDNVFDGWPRPLLWFSSARRLVLAITLFHEIGPHIHLTKVPEHREREDVADQWRNRLFVSYLKGRYWYLLPVVAALAKLIRLQVPRRHLNRFAEWAE